MIKKEKMKYYKTAQFVPNKGNAWTLYELNEEEIITRILTHLPETGEITLYAKPKLKTLFQPDRLEESSKEEFEYVWQEGEDKKK